MTTRGDETRTRAQELAVLTLVPGEHNALLVRRMLAEAEVAHDIARDVDQLLAGLAGGCGAVVTTVEAVGRRTPEVCDALDRQPDWSDVPVILFARQRQRLPAWIAPLVERGNTTLLRRPSQTTTFVSVVRSALADRRRQYAVRELLEDLERLNRHNQDRIAQLQRLTFQLSRVEERERRRLAGLLHDDLQQLLVGSQYRLNVIDRRLRHGRDLGDSVGELREQLTEAIDKARTLSHELSPPPLRRQTLTEALRWLAGRMKHAHGLQVAVEGEVSEQLEPEDLEILAYRAVQELLFNVVKHAQTDRATVMLRRDGDSLVITVSDEGAGFDPEGVDIERDADGGLGLFSIRERAHVLGGDLRLKSTPGDGCTCVLTLPLRPAPQSTLEPDEPVEAAPPAASPADSTIRVLVVDDHRYLREGVKALLAEEAGIEVVGEAGDGAQAIEAVRRLRPDVVLLDVAMPVLDGLETARRLREEHPKLRIVGLSTFGHDDMGERMREAGADTYVCKSDPGAELVAAVRGPGSR